MLQNKVIWSQAYWSLTRKAHARTKHVGFGTSELTMGRVDMYLDYRVEGPSQKENSLKEDCHQLVIIANGHIYRWYRKPSTFNTQRYIDGPQ